MYDSSQVAAVSIILTAIGVVFWDWTYVSLGFAGSAFAFYILFGLDEKRIRTPSIVSQLVLLAMGASILVSAYAGLQGTIAEANNTLPNMVVVILGFILMPMIAIGGIICACCALVSKKASHQLLVYFATEPARLKEKLF